MLLKILHTLLLPFTAGLYSGSYELLDDDSSSSAEDEEAGQLVIDDSFSQHRKKSKKSKKSKKKKDKEKERRHGSKCMTMANSDGFYILIDKIWFLQCILCL